MSDDPSHGADARDPIEEVLADDDVDLEPWSADMFAADPMTFPELVDAAGGRIPDRRAEVALRFHRFECAQAQLRGNARRAQQIGTRAAFADALGIDAPDSSEAEFAKIEDDFKRASRSLVAEGAALCAALKLDAAAIATFAVEPDVDTDTFDWVEDTDGDAWTIAAGGERISDCMRAAQDDVYAHAAGHLDLGPARRRRLELFFGAKLAPILHAAETHDGFSLAEYLGSIAGTYNYAAEPPFHDCEDDTYG